MNMTKGIFIAAVFAGATIFFFIAFMAILPKNYEPFSNCFTMDKMGKQEVNTWNQSCTNTLFKNLGIAALAAIPLTMIIYKFKDKI